MPSGMRELSCTSTAHRASRDAFRPSSLPPCLALCSTTDPMTRNRDIIATKAPEGETQIPHMLPSPERFADACSRLGIERGSHVVFYDSVGMFSSPRGAWTFKVSSRGLWLGREGGRETRTDPLGPNFEQAFGHEKVSVLDGGLLRWEAEGNYIDTSAPAPINPHSSEEPKQTSHGPIFSELLYSKRPKVESYFIADVEAHMSEYPVPEVKEEYRRSYEQVVENSKTAEEVTLDARPVGR